MVHETLREINTDSIYFDKFFDGRTLKGPDPTEVASILEVPVRELVEEANWEERPFLGSGRFRNRMSPHFDHGTLTIWGLTGRLTRDLMQLVRE